MQSQELQPRLRTALVVDDESLIRGYVEKVLREFGFAVIFAEDGDEALTLFRRYAGSIDLVVTDDFHPGTLGLPLARQIRAVSPTVPVLFLTGRARIGDAELREIGNARRLLKPVMRDVLRATVLELLGGEES